MTTPTQMTPRELAAHMGFKPNYGNQLLKDGRLVRSARPVRRMQETMLAVVTRREGRPSRAAVLAKVKEVTNA